MLWCCGQRKDTVTTEVLQISSICSTRKAKRKQWKDYQMISPMKAVQAGVNEAAIKHRVPKTTCTE